MVRILLALLAAKIAVIGIQIEDMNLKIALLCVVGGIALLVGLITYLDNKGIINKNS